MQGWSAHRRDGEEAFDEMDFRRATQPYLWSFRSASCVIKLMHVLFRSIHRRTLAPSMTATLAPSTVDLDEKIQSTTEECAMTRISSWLMVIIAVVVVVLVGGRAISAQDKYTVKVPNGLAFSEFKGYEGWQTICT